MRKIDDLLIGTYIVVGINADGLIKESKMYHAKHAATRCAKNKNKKVNSILSYFVYNITDVTIILE